MSATDSAAGTDIAAQITGLLSPMLQRQLWVCLSEPAAGPAEIFPHLPEHLRHLVAWEQQGVLFGAGPFLDDDGVPSERAMYIVRAATEADARALVAEEPLHRLGLRTFTLSAWQLNQGRVTLHVNFASQTGGLDGRPASRPDEGSHP